MKTLVMISSLKQINLPCDGVIVGIKDLSVNMPAYFEVEDLKNIDKEIFVCLNKNMHNSDLELLEKTMLELNNYNIKGVIYYDLAILSIYKRLNLNYDLVWNQEHMTTNYDTINFYKKEGVEYTIVSNDITLRECLEIKENTNSKLMITLFGYLPIFVSIRHLVKNYLKTFNLKDESNINYIYKEGKKYPVVDSDVTSVYTDFILNGLKEKLLLNYDYIILNSFMISDDKFENVLNIFNSVNEFNIDLKERELCDMFDNLDKGFFYKETIYKVK
jgi:collagenase-like PrtC family protease